MRHSVKAARWLSACGGPVLACVSAAMMTGGCAPRARDFFKTDKFRFLAPDQVVAPPDHPLVNPILQSIGTGDQHQELVPRATFPTAADLKYSDRDYVIGPTDVLDVGILDLFSPGVEAVLRRPVSESGFLSLPLLDQRIKAEGLNQEQLKDAIRAAYRRNDVLHNATVSVSVLVRRQSTFSVIGAVGRPGTYSIIRRDMRLLEALATAGGVTQTNINYLYIIRPAPAVRVSEATPQTPSGASPAPAGDGRAPLGALSAVAPREAVWFSNTAATAPADAADLEAATRKLRFIYVPGEGWKKVDRDAPEAAVPSGADRPAAAAPRAQADQPRDPYGWRKIEQREMARVIAVNLGKLNAGDPRMNIVLRDNDIIRIPTLEVGEFYVGGEVRGPGVYSLTGRRVTVKQAVTAAGNVSPLAWPENSILIRRLPDNQEQIIALNIEAIFKGEEPDLYLKPNDVICVGSDLRAPFWAVMRNAFRLTYGFGFIYDRNFSEPLTATPTSRRFTRW